MNHIQIIKSFKNKDLIIDTDLLLSNGVLFAVAKFISLRQELYS